MAEGVLHCVENRCSAILPPLIHNKPGYHACPRCRTHLQVSTFPALHRPEAEVSKGEALLVDDESSCFFHESKKASMACEGCGRFICQLCEIELGSKTICPTCLDNQASDSGEGTLKKRLVQYDSLALTVALASVLFWFVSFLTPFIVFYLTFKHWNTKMSMMPRGKWRFIVADIISLIIGFFWVAFITGIWSI